MSLEERISAKSALVGVVGLGYVGLPLCRAFHDSGFRVLGFDVDPKKISALRAGRGYLRHLGEAFVDEMARSERFEPTSDLERLGEPDAVLICVPTPLDAHLQPDLSYVISTTEAIAARLRRGQLVVLESTTYPGTTREELVPRFAKCGFTCGEDIYVAFSPEREDPGRQDHSTQTIPKLVGGIDPASGAIAAGLYRQAIEKVVEVASAEVAEGAKLLENIYRAVNIALANEMKVVLSEMGINVWEVIDAAATKPFGFQAFYPGPGLGGHCIPIDPFYLTWKARELGIATRFIELAGEVNHSMPKYVVDRTLRALNNRGKAVSASRILILGIAYKPDVDDVRESASFPLMTRLRALGAEVQYNDPHVPATHRMRHHEDFELQSIELTPQSLASFDCVIVATHHRAYDWQQIADHAPLIVDTRNALRNVRGPRDHIVLG